MKLYHHHALFYFIFHPMYYLRPLFSLPLLTIVVTQIFGRIAGSPPLPTSVRALHWLWQEKTSVLCPLVDSRRRAVTPTIRALSAVHPFLFWQITSKSHRGGIRTPGPTLEAFERVPWVKLLGQNTPLYRYTPEYEERIVFNIEMCTNGPSISHQSSVPKHVEDFIQY